MRAFHNPIDRAAADAHPIASAALLFALLAPGAASATEHGMTHADLAFIDTLAGGPLPPGVYVRDDVDINRSTRFNDQDGKQVTFSAGVLGVHPVDFRADSVADVVSLVYVPGVRIPGLNATIGAGVYGYYARSNAEAQVTILGRSTGGPETRRGFGDLTVTPLFLEWASPRAGFYARLAPFQFSAPTGTYDPTDPIGNNIGLNYWSYRPAFLMTYLKGRMEFDLNMTVSFNSKNPAKNYSSGNEFYFTYAMQRRLSRKLALGLEGYYYRQISDDRQNGVVVNTTPASSPLQSQDPLNGGPGNRGEALALGPVLSYDPLPNLFLNVHFVRDVVAHNRKQGDSLWMRATTKF